MARKRLNGTGSIYKRKDRDTWVYEYKDNLGKIRRISDRKLADLQIKIKEIDNQNNVIKDKHITIPDILKREEENKHKKNITQDSTYFRNLHTIKIIEKSNLNTIDIDDVTIHDIDIFSEGVTKYSQSSIDKIFIVLKKAFSLALQEERVRKDILIGYQKPKSKIKNKKVLAFTLEEQKKFMQLIPKSKYYYQYIIGIHTGMRMGEINALHYNDIDLNKNVINVNKTISRGINFNSFINSTTKTKNGTREVPINKFLLPILKEFIKIKKGQYLFSEERVISTPMVNSEMKRLMKRNDVNTHMIRHTFATRSIEAGVPAVVLKKLLGHADITTTLNTYVDVFEKMEKDNIVRIEEYMEKNLFGE